MMQRPISLVICFAFMFSTHAQESNLFLDAFKKRWVNSKSYTLKVAEGMPADKYHFKPVEEERSFADQLLHMAYNISWLSAQYIKNEKNPMEGKDLKNLSKEEVIKIVSDAYDYATDALNKFPVAQLADTVLFFAGPMAKLQIINLLNDHQAHHRGQLIVYLRLNGIRPPAYVGW